jgi:hypothetical protein
MRYEFIKENFIRLSESKTDKLELFKLSRSEFIFFRTDYLELELSLDIFF